ncbi:hypothetical protein Sj15T_24290 [Sphingobium sp. TA15]|uniref:Uncharacterized protein n=1 Tax=Sphingobium indicum (strain DSM 16413 / CCM 7287 / MTCC 6362 / UT26 / NBRC 101211 / UT26S) TaxID=452662 RepID=D4Z5Z8_SPHIU|nr:YhhA family cyclophane-containing RiPP [Sphingobium indicum]BAI98030.1 hypothetical protein SJA_C1-31960 [Sphingobium indicum UT26S]BDD67408.1 hypothetical protein Sj15T_24290 [Sphingobium sp. TA15]
MQTDNQIATSVDAPLNSVALARVIAEVRDGDVRAATGAYNRTYNRHNR